MKKTTHIAKNPLVMRGITQRSRAAVGQDCLIRNECGTCEFVNTSYEASLQTKYDRSLEFFNASGVLTGARLIAPAPSPHPLGYRSLMKLAVRAKSGGIATDRFSLGLFEPGTHKIVEGMEGCPLHVTPLKMLLIALKEELNASPLAPYDEGSRQGDLRYFVARASHMTGEIMVVFVVTRPLKQELLQVVSRLRRQGHKINAAFLNVNSSPGNAIFGTETVRIAGNNGLRENICELDFEIGPTAFFQVNPWQAHNLYRRVELHSGSAQVGQVAWDLYCGAGPMSLILARSGYRTLGIEENPEAIESARFNAKRNLLIDGVEFIAAKVEDSEAKIPAWAKKPSLIVVNPSRRGLHEAARLHLADVLRENAACKLLYVSCEAQTLARDLAVLTAHGHKLRQLEAFDMFAQTDNMEWLAVLTKE